MGQTEKLSASLDFFLLTLSLSAALLSLHPIEVHF